MTARSVALLCARSRCCFAVAPASASEQKPTPAELESELVCPVCETTLDSSDAPVARLMKARIRERIAAGDTKSEIKAYFVDQFGTGVLAVPPRKGFDWSPGCSRSPGSASGSSSSVRSRGAGAAGATTTPATTASRSIPCSSGASTTSSLEPAST